MKVKFHPLDKAIEIAESTGLEVTYAYEDLVFSEHSVFILQFDNLNASQLFLFFNCNCIASTVNDFTLKMTNKAIEIGLKLINKGTFSLSPVEGKDELEIVFK
jgi:hypothetical protein